MNILRRVTDTLRITRPRRVVEETDVEKCRRAIKLYLDTLHRPRDARLPDVVAKLNAVIAKQGAEGLAKHGNEGIRVGGRGSVNVKLRYWRGCFSISRGEAEDRRHRMWEEEIGQVFKDAGLPFNYQFARL